MTELDVTLTDWAIALVAGVFAWRIRREGPPGPVRFWLGAFFWSVAAAALLGGLVHGFFLDERTWGARFLWPATLLGVGVTAVTAWVVGARLAFGPAVARGVTAAAALVFAGYAGLVVFWRPLFGLAVAHYLPAVLFLLVVLVRVWRKWRDGRVGQAALGLGVILAGSWVQWRGIALHPVYFTPNALYHVIALAGLVLFFNGARRLAAGPATR